MLASFRNTGTPCKSIIGQDQRESIEQSMKDTVDEMIGAFDRHLEDSAASAKQQFRWMKRRYREKIDVNRAASRIELKVCKGAARKCMTQPLAFEEPRRARNSENCKFRRTRSMFPRGYGCSSGTETLLFLAAIEAPETPDLPCGRSNWGMAIPPLGRRKVGSKDNLGKNLKKLAFTHMILLIKL